MFASYAYDHLNQEQSHIRLYLVSTLRNRIINIMTKSGIVKRFGDSIVKKVLGIIEYWFNKVCLSINNKIERNINWRIIKDSWSSRSFGPCCIVFCRNSVWIILEHMRFCTRCCTLLATSKMGLNHIFWVAFIWLEEFWEKIELCIDSSLVHLVL